MNSQEENGRMIGGVMLVGLGVLFLLGQVTGFDFGMIWPLFVIVPGTIFLTIALRSNDEKTIGFIFPGIVVTGTGLILAYQNITGHWESWAYIWALYPVMVGVAMRYFGQRTGKEQPVKISQKLIIGWLIAFVIMGAMFELFIFNGVGLGVIASLIPLAMIGGGAFLILRSSQSNGKAKRKSHDFS